MSSASTVVAVDAWEALDSRGRPTIGCAVQVGCGAEGRVIVPAGASVGGYEAVEHRDGGSRYAGHGVLNAVHNVHDILRPEVLGLDATDQQAVDSALESTDSREDLGTVGANAILAISIAVARAAAAASRKPLWEFLGGPDPLLPMPMVNIVSGGAHAGRSIDLQDVLVIPVGARTFRQALEWVSMVRSAAADLVHKLGGVAHLVADEGGLSHPFKSNESAIRLVTEAIFHAHLEPGKDVALAIDCAANQIVEDERYELRSDSLSLSREEWLGLLSAWAKTYPIVSLEDVLAEDDWDGWESAVRTLSAVPQVVGDDFFATNESRLRRGLIRRVASAVLVKPNQAGTVTRTHRVLSLAKANHFGTIVSARSGDTEDHWLADFAVGWRAGQIKVGSTTRSERTSKWNRLLEIESRAAERAEMARWPAIGEWN